jgi:putative DNA primase/helicase
VNALRQTARDAELEAHYSDDESAIPIRFYPETYFDDRKRFIASKLGEQLVHEAHLCAGRDGRLYRYEDGVYLPDGDAWARRRTRDVLGERWARKYADEVVGWLRDSEPIITGEPVPSLLNVTNGMLAWKTGNLLEHSPKQLSTVRIPHAWNPEATCPAVDAFLRQVLPDDCIELAYEIAGYALYPGNPLRKAVMAYGAGRNGKTVFLRVVESLIGPANCSSVPLQSLTEDRFAAASLHGRLANICGDLDARAIRRSDLFKQATGGDNIEAQRKFGQPFSFRPIALFLFSANEVPIVSDQTQAWFDRWIIVPFERRIPDGQVDPDLVAKLTRRSELEGFLVKAVAGLRRLMERGRFDLPDAVVEAGDAYRERLDTTKAFLAESCTVHPDAWVPRSALYAQYRQWCTDTGRLALSSINFNDRLRRDLVGTVTETIRRGNRGWQGVGLGVEEQS